MGKPSVASVAAIRTVPFTGFNPLPALKIDLVHDPRNPLTRCGSIPNDNNMAAWEGGRESVRIDEVNSCGIG
jgi:hypothetical protein